MKRYYAWHLAGALAGSLVIGGFGGFGAIGNAILDWASSVRIHVVYNASTNNHSKFYRDGRYFLAGTQGDQIYVCEVSQEFWEFAEENEHYTLPGAQCREIKP